MSAQLVSARVVTTRKPHRCFACNRVFDSKTEMVRSVNVMDGEIYNLYSCPTCEEIMKNHSEYVFDESEQWFEEGCVINSMSGLSEKELKIRTPEGFLRYLKNE